jgi:capsular polysaccharide export protein
MRAVGILVPAILRIPHLSAFLEPWGKPFLLRAARRAGFEMAAVAGWGYKRNAERARAEAARRGLPYLALEDGFMRSIGLGVSGAPPWSIVADDVGIYYDPRRPSQLERLIAAGTPTGPDTRMFLEMMRRHNLSKYNDAPDLHPPPHGDGRPLVIVLDQTVGDISVLTSGADAGTFEAMLDAAHRENPGARLIVRPHPDVIAGRREGYLGTIARRRGVEVLLQRASWPSLAVRAARVYTVTSLAGFEALIRGVPVSCFGLPFYAGWGLTDDRAYSGRVACPGRVARPTVEALVEAAYRRYPRYVDPVRGVVCDALDIGQRIAATRRLLFG